MAEEDKHDETCLANEERSPSPSEVAYSAPETDLEKQSDEELQTIDLSTASDNDTNAGDDLDPNEKSAAQLLKEDIPWIERFIQVVKTYASLGLVAFGSSTAHVGMLRDHLVVQRKWFDDDEFTELYAMGQGVPGSISNNLVVSTALARAGPIGGITACILFNLPGMIVLITCGVLIATFVDPHNPPWYLVGLPPAAISLVFKAFYGLGQKLDKLGIVLCLISALMTVLAEGDERIDTVYVYPALLLLGGIVSYIDSKCKKPYGTYKSASKGLDAESELTTKRIGIPLWVGGLIWVLWAVILGSTASYVGHAHREGREVNVYLEIFEVMFRGGSLSFGGGTAVLPMLQAMAVPEWMTDEELFQGVGLATTMPGPSFNNFSAYLGAVYQGVAGGLVAWVGLLSPCIMLIFGMVPFWARLRHIQGFKSALKGVNAAAIGLVGAACVILWEGAVDTAADAMVFILAGTLATVYGWGAHWVVLAGGIFGAILHEDALNIGQVEL